MLPDRHLIIRTAWLYSEYGSNFARTIAGKISQASHFVLSMTRLGNQPIHKTSLPELLNLLDFTHQEMFLQGIFHSANTGSATRWEFAVAIGEFMGHDASQIGKIPSEELGLPARRPSDSRLMDLRALGGGLVRCALGEMPFVRRFRKFVDRYDAVPEFRTFKRYSPYPLALKEFAKRSSASSVIHPLRHATSSTHPTFTP